MTGPLHGIRVVECVSHDCPLALRLAIALTGRIAADLGADVVKLGDPAHDPVATIAPFVGPRSALASFVDHNKRWEPLAGNVSDAAATLRTQPAPQVILCDAAAAAQLDGYAPLAVTTVFAMAGGAGPAQAASEFTMMAASGLLDLVGDPEREPLKMGGHQLAYACALSAYGATIAALVAAQRDGLGERVSVNLADVAVWLNWKSVALAAWTGSGRSRQGQDAEWQVLRCADGWIALVYLEADWPVLRAFVADARLDAPEYDDRRERRRAARRISAIIENKFLGCTRAELKDMALARRLPLGPVWTPCELEHDAQNVVRHFFQRYPQADGPPLLMPRLPVLWNGNAFGPGAAA